MTIILNGTTGITTPGITNQGVVEFTAGSVSAPSITTTGDVNTGIFFPAADTIAFSEGGVEAARFDSSGNLGIGTTSPGSKLDVVGVVQWQASAGTVLGKLTYSGGEPVILANTGLGLRFFTNNTQTAILDSSGNLGIGTTSPGTKLEVYVTRTSATNAVAINLNDNVTGIQTDGVYKAIRSLSNGNASVSEIRFLETGGTNNDTSIAFATQSTAGALTERMRINQVGNLGLGVTLSTWTSTAHIGRVFQTGGAAYFGRTDNADGYFSSNVYRDTSDWKYYTNNGATMIQQSGGTFYMYGADSGTANNAVTWTQIFQISKGNSLALQGATNQSGAGITFPATKSASTNANTLDDYEEGTWTPTILFGGANTSATYAIQVGTYTKIGNVVYYQAYVQESTASTSSGIFTVGGLPFTSRNTSNLYMVGAAALDNAAVNIDQPVTQMLNNVTDIRIASGTNTNNWNILDQTVRGGAFRVYISGFYYT